MDSFTRYGLPARPLTIALGALALLIVTVTLGATLGLKTRAQFGEVAASWSDYAEGAERKGALISEVRGYLGFGGIIHNFKNYVLRQDPEYLRATEAQLAQFRATLVAFEGLSLTPEERAAVTTIGSTVAEYERKLPLAVQAAAEGWPPAATDALVRVDDTAAIAALAALERSWRQDQARSTGRLFAAITQGRTLIWIGFWSIVALTFASLTVGLLLFVLFRGLRRAISDLQDELTKRQEVENARERLATIVEQSPATILLTGTDARIEYANRKFEDATGWSREEIRGQTPLFLQSGETDETTYRAIRARLQGGQAWHGVFRNLRKDGSSYWAETTLLPLKAPDGTVQNYVGIGEDISEARQAREQVVRAQKLEAVGQLAGGVAHDFNNILTTIMGSCHLAAMDAAEGSDIAGEVEQIGIAARRAQALVRELLTFARREPGAPRPVALYDVVMEVSNLLQASLPPVIRIACSEPEGVCNVVGDPTHLNQIILNLCRNAAEAIGGDPGLIQLSIRRENAPDGLPAAPEGWVRLDVADDGPGMSEDTKRRLFEPFFTTKPIGKGSGLGLAVVFGLVEELGGSIRVESSLGAGARFSVFLPATLQPAVSELIPSDPLPRGNERIILIDDEAEVAGTFRRLLLRLGYRVDAYTSPLVALERFRNAPDSFDLAISDMVMPDLTGEELVQRLRAHNPELPVIFCSGYGPDVVGLDGAPPVMLDKPVYPDVLARHVRTVLDEASAQQP
ncbi:MAG: PAS domain S-box protein [Pseudomonadota bacterium]